MASVVSSEVTLRELGGLSETLRRRASNSEFTFMKFALPDLTTDQILSFSSSLGTIDALLITSDQAISWRQLATDTAMPIAANGHVMISGTAITSVRLSNSSGSTANVTVAVSGTRTSWYSGATGQVAKLPYFNVTDAAYGAKGDGITDDSAAIQAAITAAIAAGGGVVLLPPGTYLLAASLAINGDNVTMLGSGRGSTILKIGNAMNGAAIVASKTAGTVTVNNICVKHLTIDGNETNNTSNYCDLFFQYVTHGTIEDVEVKESHDIGIGVGNGAVAGPTSTDIEVINCFAHQNNGNGFDINNSARVRVTDCLSEYNGTATSAGAGFFTGHGTDYDIRFSGCTSRYNKGPGFHATSATGNISTADIWISDSFSHNNTAAGSSAGEAFLLNQDGTGSMPGPFVLVNNLATANDVNSISTGGTVTNIVNFNNNFSMNGTVVVGGGGMVMNNNVSIYGYNAAGTAKSLLYIDASDAINVGRSSTGQPLQLFSGGAGVQIVFYDSAAAEMGRVSSLGIQATLGDLKTLVAGKGVIMTNAGGTVTKRVRLNDAGDGLIYETP